MKTVRFHKTGGREVLLYEDVPDLKPGPGHGMTAGSWRSDERKGGSHG